MKLYIKNMVCIRCKMVVKAELEKLGLHYIVVELGEAEIMESISEEQHDQFKEFLLSADKRGQGNWERDMSESGPGMRVGELLRSRRGKERLPVYWTELKSIGEEANRAEMGGTAYTSFQIADAAQAQPGALGQLFLRERGRGSQMSQQISERRGHAAHDAPLDYCVGRVRDRHR